MLTLFFLRIIINLLPLYRLSCFVSCSLVIFVYFYVLVLTLQLASVLLSLHVNKHKIELNYYAICMYIHFFSFHNGWRFRNFQFLIGPWTAV
jgi:hypothetical protein